MLPTQQYSSPSAAGEILILEPHTEASQEKHLDMPEPFSPTFTADQSRGRPMQRMAVDELSEDAHLDEEVNTLDVVVFVSDFVGTLFRSASPSCEASESTFTDPSFNIRALEDPTLRSIVAWGPSRDCFFVVVRIFFFLIFIPPTVHPKHRRTLKNAQILFYPSCTNPSASRALSDYSTSTVLKK
jgi:hypothetical protein